MRIGIALAFAAGCAGGGGGQDLATVPDAAQDFATVRDASGAPDAPVSLDLAIPPDHGMPFDAASDLTAAIDQAVPADLVMVDFSNGPPDFAGFGFALGQSFAGVAGPIVTADLNGDGKLDLLLTENGSLAALLGKGDGTFADPVVSIPGASNGCFADFDGDGKLDTLLDGTTALGNGDCTFRVGNALPGTAPWAAGDFNGDGKADLLARMGLSGNTFLGSGTDSFTALDLTAFQVNAIPPCAWIANLDGDGTLDLIDEFGSMEEIAYGKGDGHFTIETAFMNVPGATQSHWFTVGDTDGDGLPDAVAAVYFPKLFQDGIWRWPQFGPATIGLVPGLAADFDGDGRIDIVSAKGPFGELRGYVWLGRSDGSFAEGPYDPALDQAAAYGVGDFNGDGRADLAVLSNTLVIYLSR